jgi:general secretion pathway protein H
MDGSKSKKIKFCNLRFSIRISGGKGFTLIELIIVLFVIGIASGLVGIVVSRSSGNFELKNFTKDLSTVLRYARNQAVTEKKIYCFFIDSNERMYRLYAENGKDGDEDANGDSSEKFTQVLHKPIPGELEMTIRGRDPESSFIEFFSVGNSTGGVVEVVNQKGTVYSVTVNRITGKVEVRQGES